MTDTWHDLPTLERRLRDAMLASDVHELEALLSPELLFTNHLGHVMTRDDDLEAHRTGFAQIEALEILETRTVLAGTSAVVSAHVRLRGSFGGVHAEAEMRFTRVWAREADGHRRVIAGHASAVVSEQR